MRRSLAPTRCGASLASRVRISKLRCGFAMTTTLLPRRQTRSAGDQLHAQLSPGEEGLFGHCPPQKSPGSAVTCDCSRHRTRRRTASAAAYARAEWLPMAEHKHRIDPQRTAGSAAAKPDFGGRNRNRAPSAERDKSCRMQREGRSWLQTIGKSGRVAQRTFNKNPEGGTDHEY